MISSDDIPSEAISINSIFSTAISSYSAPSGTASIKSELSNNLFASFSYATHKSVPLNSVYVTYACRSYIYTYMVTLH